VRILEKLLLGVVLLILSPSAFAQKPDLRFVRSKHEVTAVIGQIVEVGLEGIEERRAPSLPVERFEVIVWQNGQSFAAAVRGATPTLTLGQEYAESLSKAREVPNPQELAANLKPVCLLSFTVPLGLVPGKATVNITYKGSKRSDDFNFTIVDLPPTPRIIKSVATYSANRPKVSLSPEQLKNSRGSEIKIRAGEDLQLDVRPLIDPETPASAVLVTFKQGSIRREVKARVAGKEPVQSDEKGLNFSPMWYEVLVRPPDELSEGPVDIEVRLSINGKLSEPGIDTATVMDPDSSSSNEFPRVVEIGNTKIGPGQATQLIVNRNDSTVDPSEFVVILEQGSSRKIIKPERVLAPNYRGKSVPVILFMRAPAELKGKFTVSVADESRALKTTSVSEIELEIGEDVLPPIVTRIIEASKQDIGMLAAMREQALRSGNEFRDYDPLRRYVTIQATGIDYEPTHVRIRLSQGNRNFLLAPEDFALSLGDRHVIRLPEQIVPGEVLITVQNIGFHKTSDPATGVVEITQPPRKR
jgi:hypothetical protein